MSVTCPQCRSTDVTMNSLFELAECNYCTNEFYPDEKFEEINRLEYGRKILIPSLKTPLTIRNVDDDVIYLNGERTAQYKLVVHPNGQIDFKRQETNFWGSTTWKTESEDIDATLVKEKYT